MTADIQDDSAPEATIDSELAVMTREELISEIVQLRKQVVRLAEEVVKSEMSSWQVQSQHERMEYLVKESRAYTDMLESQSRDLRSSLAGLESTREALAKAEQAIRDSQTKLDRLQQISHIGYWEWDLRSDRISRSLELLGLLGIPGPGPSTADLAQAMLVSHEDATMFDSSIRHILSSGQPGSFEYQAIRPDGGVRHMRVWAEILHSESGDPAIIFGIVQDITAEKKK